MKTKNGIGFWHSTFPNQLGNLCFVLFLVGLALFILHAGLNLNVFDPDDFKSMDERIPALGTRRVVDEAGVLTQSEIDSLTAQIDAYEAASKGQMAVLVIASLHGDAIEDFSLAVAEKWKIGWRGEDNGILLLLSVDDHEDRLEIGYGLEGIINDARAGDILRNMAPFLRRGEYAHAISFAIASVAAFVLHENGPEVPGETDEDEGGSYASPRNGPEETLFCVIAILIVLQLIGTITARIMIHPDIKKSIGLIVMIIILRILLEVLKGMARGGGGRGGRSGGGSSRSGGGGGSFGGGGASGRW
jgi:uncharacterized protein